MGLVGCFFPPRKLLLQQLLTDEFYCPLESFFLSLGLKIHHPNSYVCSKTGNPRHWAFCSKWDCGQWLFSKIPESEVIRQSPLGISNFGSHPQEALGYQLQELCGESSLHIEWWKTQTSGSYRLEFYSCCALNTAIGDWMSHFKSLTLSVLIFKMRIIPTLQDKPKTWVIFGSTLSSYDRALKNRGLLEASSSSACCLVESIDPGPLFYFTRIYHQRFAIYTTEQNEIQVKKCKTSNTKSKSFKWTVMWSLNSCEIMGRVFKICNFLYFSSL